MRVDIEMGSEMTGLLTAALQLHVPPVFLDKLLKNTTTVIKVRTTRACPRLSTSGPRGASKPALTLV